MAMKTKLELKDVFSGLSSIMLVKGGITNFTTVTPDFDLPVTVDSLSLSQAEPTLNRTKVHGLQADWAVTSTAGDIINSFNRFISCLLYHQVSPYQCGAEP
jgi:hypothetical protein